MAQTMLYLAQAPSRPFLGELAEEDIPTKTFIRPHAYPKVSVGGTFYYLAVLCLVVLLGFETGFLARLFGWL